MKKIFLKWSFLGVILCEKSIARTPKMWKRFLDSEHFQHKKQVFLKKILYVALFFN